MQKRDWTWTTPRFHETARMLRWGHFGTPVLIFPTAGGDVDEIERFNLISALSGLIDQGRLKVYSIDGLCVRAWLSGKTPEQDYPRLQENYDSFVKEDVLERIRADCENPKIEPLLAGASRGAGMAISALCSYPESFRAAIGLSGLYSRSLAAKPGTPAARLERLRRRAVRLGTGEGDYEKPESSQRLSETLTNQGVPCRLDLWGPRDHTWTTWREKFPPLLAELLQEPA